MKKDIDLLLEIALTPMELPDQELNDQILRRVKERQDMKNDQVRNRRRIPAAALVTACILMLCSSTAFAVYKYLTPAEAATEVDDKALRQAFLGEDAILVNETQESGGYRVTLLGSVAGRRISDFMETDDHGEVLDDRIYTVVAIERADGTPMPDTSSDEYGNEAFYVSHYIRGLDPKLYSVMRMGGGYTAFVKNGVQYRILDMDNIEMFADRGIYVGVSAGTFYDAEAYVYNAETGEMRRNESYTGVNALFRLPVDASKADPAAAEAYLKALDDDTDQMEEPVEKDAVDLSVEAFMEKLTPENIDEYAAPVEATRQTCTVDEDGLVHYSYKTDNDEGGGAQAFDMLFPDGRAGISPVFGCSYSESGLADLCIDVFILNEDGTVTYVVYQPKACKIDGDSI